jgi:uncharacterized membrane protein YkvA (DUF1232 family)
MATDDVKFGDILLPGEDEESIRRQEKSVREKFWGVLKKYARYIPFARDAVAAFYCATDPATPRRVKGILLAALGYFILPLDAVPDIFSLIGFTDDLAVLTTAIAMVRGHMKPEHYEAADRALAGEADPKIS